MDSQEFIPTPLTDTATSPSPTMDSDDDMMSAASGEEMDFDDGTQASDLGSGMSNTTRLYLLID